LCDDYFLPSAKLHGQQIGDAVMADGAESNAFFPVAHRACVEMDTR
jgi:hypothetical protein